MLKHIGYLFFIALVVLLKWDSSSIAGEIGGSSAGGDPLAQLLSVMHSDQWKQLNAPSGAGQPINAISPFTKTNYDGLPASDDAWSAAGVQNCATALGPTPCNYNGNIFSYSAPAIRATDGMVCDLQTGGHAASGWSGVLCFDTKAAATCVLAASDGANPTKTSPCGAWKEKIHPATFVGGWHPRPSGSPQLAPFNSCQTTWLNGVNFLSVAVSKPNCDNFPSVYVIDGQTSCLPHAATIPNISLNISATATSGSPTLTNFAKDPSTSGVYNGMVVTGRGIPSAPPTIVNAVTDATVSMMDPSGNPVNATSNATGNVNFTASGNPPVVTLAKTQRTTCAQSTPVTINFGCEFWVTPNRDGITVASPAHNYYSNKSIPGTTKWTAGNGPNGALTLRGCGPREGGATLYDDATNIYQTNLGYPATLGLNSNGFAGNGIDGFTVGEAADDLSGCLFTMSSSNLIKYCENADGTGAPIDGNFHVFTVARGAGAPADFTDTIVFAPPWAPTQRWWFQFQRFAGGTGPYSCYDLGGHQTFTNGCFNLWKDIDGTPMMTVQQFTGTSVPDRSQGGGALSNGICWDATAQKILYAAGTQHIYQINVVPDVSKWGITEFTSNPSGDTPPASVNSGGPAALGCLQPKYTAEILVVAGQVYIHKD